MTMLVPGQNQLADPEIVKVEAFETLLAEFKAFVVDYVKARDPESAAKLEQSLANESELVTMLFEAFIARLQTHTRQYNARIKEMLAWWAKGTNLDARLADMGLERQVLDPGDPDAFPPVPATYESEDSARLRYYLAPHAPAAGSRLHYCREARTLGERAGVAVATPREGVVTVTYTFGADSNPAKIKDASAQRVEPGHVLVTVLAREASGAVPADLLAAVRAHFAREDVVPETDTVTVQGAEILSYRIRAVVYINSGPDASLTKAAAVKALQGYADNCHALGGRIEPSWIDYSLHTAGAVRLEVLEPLAPVVASASQAPYCAGIEIEVRTL